MSVESREGDGTRVMSAEIFERLQSIASKVSAQDLESVEQGQGGRQIRSAFEQAIGQVSAMRVVTSEQLAVRITL